MYRPYVIAQTGNTSATTVSTALHCMTSHYTVCHCISHCVTLCDTVQVVRILLNLLGLSVPIPLCLSESLKAYQVALLGFVSPILNISLITLFVLG